MHCNYKLTIPYFLCNSKIFSRFHFILHNIIFVNGIQQKLVFYFSNSYKKHFKIWKDLFCAYSFRGMIHGQFSLHWACESWDLRAPGKCKDSKSAGGGYILQRHTSRQALLSRAHHLLIVQWWIHPWIDPMFWSKPWWHDQSPKASHLNTWVGSKHSIHKPSKDISCSNYKSDINTINVSGYKALGNWLFSNRL